ncbi:hypothetical protein [Paenibacillus segetis]|uniref:Uncharacterized protein n=1 Tax=Paenibacillus segetis TaxID=1325360 RepID=A0ABQ1YME3_9BACL|nr:hypothetical protein [Paenibacillus segetis]GGH31623.1 hypothetical protein GCM10008013_35460 [Paenibacillus segetis]
MVLISLAKVFAEKVPDHEFYRCATALIGETSPLTGPTYQQGVSR